MFIACEIALLTLVVVLVAPMVWAIYCLVKSDPIFQSLMRRGRLLFIRELSSEQRLKVLRLCEQYDERKQNLMTPKRKERSILSRISRLESQLKREGVGEAEVSKKLEKENADLEQLAFDQDCLVNSLSSLWIEKTTLICHAKCDRLLTRRSSAWDVINRMEQKVVDLELAMKEAEIKSIASIAESSEPNPVPFPDAPSEDLDFIISKFKDVSKWGEQISTNLVALDPNLDRAYERLSAQFRGAIKAAKISIQSETELEDYLVRLGIKPDLKYEPASSNLNCSEDFVPESNGNVFPLKSSVPDNTIEVVTRTLKATRRINFLIDQRLFFAEEIVRRLYVVKVLLSAIPAAPGSEILKFRSLVVYVCHFLTAVVEGEESAGEVTQDGIARRVSALEASTLQTYSDFATDKVDLALPLHSRFCFDIKAALAVIEAKMTDLKPNIEKWSGLSTALNLNDNKFAAHVATGRQNSYLSIMKQMEKSFEILTVTLTAFEQQESDVEKGVI